MVAFCIQHNSGLLGRFFYCFCTSGNRIEYYIRHKRIQDFIWSAIFSSKKVTTFLVVVLNTQAKTAKYFPALVMHMATRTHCTPWLRLCYIRYARLTA